MPCRIAPVLITSHYQFHNFCDDILVYVSLQHQASARNCHLMLLWFALMAVRSVSFISLQSPGSRLCVLTWTGYRHCILFVYYYALAQSKYKHYQCICKCRLQIVVCLSRPQHIGAEINGRRFPDDILKCIFLNEKLLISNKISLKFVPKGQINNIPSLV